MSTTIQKYVVRLDVTGTVSANSRKLKRHRKEEGAGNVQESDMRLEDDICFAGEMQIRTYR